MIDRDDIFSALGQVIDPELGRSLVELDMIEDVGIVDDRVLVRVALTAAGCPLKGKITADIKETVGSVDGVKRVEVEMSAMTPAQRQALTAKLQAVKPALSIEKGTQVIGVASGKGGVGKSTVTVNLALALAGLGKQVGLLDADIWGFSIPRMLGVKTRPTVMRDRMIPLDKYDLKVMSIGFFLAEEQPIIWRGPLVHRAIEQFLTQVSWGALDYLLVDLPPGTGDVTITLSRLVPDLKVIMVTTPQAAAAKVAVRAGHMAHKVNAEVVGIIENMSYLVCQKCGEKNYLFGRGGGDDLARALGAPLLGRLSLDPALTAGGDTGAPIVVARPDAVIARQIMAAAQSLISGNEEKQAAAGGR